MTTGIRAIEYLVLVFFVTIISPKTAAAISGNDWKRIPESNRQAYIMGVVDTWRNVSDLVGLDNSSKAGVAETMLIEVVKCAADKMPYSQITAIVDKYMADTPSQWHHAMASIVWTAVATACGMIK